MAFFIPGISCCPLCKLKIDINMEIVGTTHFVSDPKDPLYEYSDAVIHKKCFTSWTLRNEFVKKYNETIGKITWGNGTYHHMSEDGKITSLPRQNADNN
ncbi:hypothetical protein LBMAG53_21910 [Planctomycetota bacterium]|nr:hypothetical protein LBMAG53_21910 [Planctomycetota bacterium]